MPFGPLFQFVGTSCHNTDSVRVKGFPCMTPYCRIPKFKNFAYTWEGKLEIE